MAAPKPAPAPVGTPILAWIGRLDALKDWRLFLAIAAAATTRGIVDRVWLVGPPSEPEAEQHLLALAQTLGVLPQLRWFSGLPHARVPELLDTVRDSGGVLSCTSRSESFGMTVYEAMARACPVLAPRQPPFADVLTDGTDALLYDPGSSADAVARLATIVDSPDRHRAMGEAGRATALAHCHPARSVATLASTLRRFVAAR